MDQALLFLREGGGDSGSCNSGLLPVIQDLPHKRWCLFMTWLLRWCMAYRNMPCLKG